MRRGVVFVIGLSLLACSPFRARANEPTCIVHVEGDPTGLIDQFHDTPGGLLLGAENGLFRYDGTRTIQVQGDPTGRYIREFYDTPGGVLLNAQNGLFRYDGRRIVHVEGDPTGLIVQFHDTPGGLLLAAENGLFRYDGRRTIHVAGDPTHFHPGVSRHAGCRFYGSGNSGCRIHPCRRICQRAMCAAPYLGSGRATR
jgi:hypothetical protein